MMISDDNCELLIYAMMHEFGWNYLECLDIVTGPEREFNLVKTSLRMIIAARDVNRRRGK